MDVTHRLLKRQLSRYLGLEPDAVPDDLVGFVTAIDEAYQALDSDRELIASTLAVSSREVRQRNEEVRALFAAIPDAVLRVDQRGVIMTYKPGADADLELPFEDVVGMPLRAALPPEMADAIDEGRTAASSDELVTVEFELTNGSVRSHYEGRIVPVEADQHIVVVRDITDQYLARAALERAATSAESANRAKSHFLANMSHELRTPLNAIIGYSEMVMEELEDLGEDDLGTDMKKINAAGRHLLQLVSDILDLSKIEAGKMQVKASTFTIASLVEDVSATVAPMVDRNNNKFMVDVSEQLDGLSTDFMRVKQVLLNLISNAAKFTKDGVITLSIQPSDDERVSMAVSDTGIGMNNEQLGRLFKAFSQASDDTTQKFGGTGLGLLLSRRFCQMMGGDISVTSKPGKGTTFTAVLPREMPVPPKSA